MLVLRLEDLDIATQSAEIEEPQLAHSYRVTSVIDA